MSSLYTPNCVISGNQLSIGVVNCAQPAQTTAAPAAAPTAQATALATAAPLARIGVGLTLAALPLISVIGFVGLGLYPVLAAVVVFTVARRVTNFALSRPAREALYVPLSRAEKYKAKNLIDTVVYRVGDQVGAWTNTALLWLGLGIGGIALTAAPLAAVWLVLSLWLGRRYVEGQRRGDAVHAPPP